MPKGFVGKPIRWLLFIVAAIALPAVLIGWKHWSFGRDFDAEVWQDQVAIHEGARRAIATGPQVLCSRAAWRSNLPARSAVPALPSWQPWIRFPTRC